MAANATGEQGVTTRHSGTPTTVPPVGTADPIPGSGPQTSPSAAAILTSPTLDPQLFLAAHEDVLTGIYESWGAPLGRNSA